MNNVRLLTHSSIRIEGIKTVYVDPFHVLEEFKDADVICVTHEHFDHYSPEDIRKVSKDSTLILAPESMKGKMEFDNVQYVSIGETVELDNCKVEVVPSYNVGKPFHTKDKNWVGYIVEMEGERIYVAGDTDINEDVVKVKCDIALVPIGGKFTMTASEAAELVNTLKPKLAICTHYGGVAGTKEDEEVFKKNVNKEIIVEVRMENYTC